MNNAIALGAQFAWDELSLVLFTALSPSGAIAAIIMVMWLMRNTLSGKQRTGIERRLYIPLLISMVGLVASASHLGTPSNALYALTGVGRSPLSNEVMSGVLFLGLLGPYWWYCFSDKANETIKQIWRVPIVATGILFITAISLAYSVETIPSWNSPLVPVSLWLNAFLGGPVLALFAIGRASALEERSAKRAWALISVAAVSLVLNAATYGAYFHEIAQLGNFMVGASDLVPFPIPAIVAFVILAAAGIVVLAKAARSPLPADSKRAAAASIAGLMLVFAAIFLMRFTFYMLHFTVGL